MPTGMMAAPSWCGWATKWCIRQISHTSGREPASGRCRPKPAFPERRNVADLPDAPLRARAVRREVAVALGVRELAERPALASAHGAGSRAGLKGMGLPPSRVQDICTHFTADYCHVKMAIRIS